MRRPVPQPAAASDLQVYRDQLSEIDRDLARGVIAETEAGRIRADALTVSGRTMGENCADARPSDRDVIRTVADPLLDRVFRLWLRDLRGVRWARLLGLRQAVCPALPQAV